MSAQTFVFISASSPLFNYAPTRNGPIGSSWNQIEDGSQCAGPATFAVQLDNLYFSEITYFWQASGNFAVSVGLDGALQSGSATSGGVSLSAQSGPHDARLEVGCKDCGSVGETFTLRGVRLTTDLTGTNATLDDSSPSITYQGFTSTNAGASNIPAISNGVFFQQTVSYTSTSGSTASFSFEGSALYVFGPTGPAFGSFSVEIDGNSLGSFNASTTLDAYDNLLFFVSHLATSTSHTAKFTCQNEGLIFALDRFVAVQGTAGSGTGAGVPNTVIAGPTVTTINGVTTTIGGTNPTAVFPIQTPINEAPGGHNGSAAAAIGGTLGALAAVILFWIWWRYRRYRKAGGEGDFFAGCCGPWGRARAAAKAEEAKFKMWPMLSFKPKYAT